MIEGVVVKDLKTYPDERGFFRELARLPDIGFKAQQVSLGMRHQSIGNGWHIHRQLSELFFVITGAARVVLRDCRTGEKIPVRWKHRYDEVDYCHFGQSSTPGEYQEVVSGEHLPRLILIPAGVAHGYKVIQGPCNMIYVANLTYDVTQYDEGRIEWDRWGNWMRDTEVI